MTGQLLLFLACAATAPPVPAPSPDPAGAFAEIDRRFEEYRLDAHVPGLVYGVVMDGRLIHVRTLGVQDLEARRPLTPDSLFRVASMTKAFTALAILKLRDEGRLALDAPAETYLPEIRGWRYPTEDSPRIRVRDLLTHTAGLVTDDPWGDRQTPLPEEDSMQLHKAGLLKPRPTPVSEALAAAYAAAVRMYESGDVASGDVLAMNFLLDRSAEAWTRELAKLKAEVGGCQTGPPMVAIGALSGDFTWRCEHGRVTGSLLLAPTWPPRIQALTLARATP